MQLGTAQLGSSVLGSASGSGSDPAPAIYARPVGLVARASQAQAIMVATPQPARVIVGSR